MAMEDSVSQGFLEVQGPDGKTYRFARGTKAGFAMERIKAKLMVQGRVQPGGSLCIQAIKRQVKDRKTLTENEKEEEEGEGEGEEEEEPVEFGPDSDLACLGNGWALRAVILDHHNHIPPQPHDTSRNSRPKEVDVSKLYPGGKLPKGRNAELTFEYIGKVVLCFIIMIIAGGVLKALLEHLPSHNVFSNEMVEDIDEL